MTRLTPFALGFCLALTAGAWTPATPLTRAEPMLTEWGAKVTPENVWRDYPRPQMVRRDWISLNGLWNYRIWDVTNGIPEKYDGEILVPFAAGSSLSGVARYPGHTNCLWYARTFSAKPRKGYRTLLHIDGSDFRTQVFVNGVEVTDVPHETAQLALTCDITAQLKAGENKLDIETWDPMGGNALSGYSSGKQTLRPDACFYTPSTGIWAPVWLEEVPETHITGYKATPDLDAGAVDVLVDGVGDVKGAAARVEVRVGEQVLASAAIAEWGKPVRLVLPKPVKAWSPESPFLYDLRITLGEDDVRGYFGLRKFEVRKDPQGVLRFYLNNEVYFAIGTLDQGWWPDGLLTPPSDEAMAFDILALKKMGFNMMRKHIKVEPMRYYHLCDKLGILVLQDMPSGGGDLNGRYGRYRAELKGMIDQLYNAPSIVMWIPYNERWGQPKQAQTSWTLTWVKRYDPSRVVDGPSGWSDYEGGFLKSLDGKGTLTPTRHLPEGVKESADVIDFHAYPGPVMLPVNSHRATFIGEFGGLGYKTKGHVWYPDARGWGYGGTGKDETVAPVEIKYHALMDKLAMLAGEGLAGSVYTQTTDVEQEINGLLTYDRRHFKFDVSKLKAAHERVCAAAIRGATCKAVTTTLLPRFAPNAWRYSFTAPAAGWQQPGFADADWKTSTGGFGSKHLRPAAKVATPWHTKDIWLRTTFDGTQTDVDEVVANIYHDEDTEIYLNGELVLTLKGYNHGYDPFAIDAARFKALMKPKGNVLAVHVKQTYGEQYFDMDLVVRGFEKGKDK